MDSFKVRAVVNVYGMRKGSIYTLEGSSTVDALIDGGFVRLLEGPPVPEPIVTEVVKKRAPKNKVAEPETLVFEAEVFQHEDPYFNDLDQYGVTDGAGRDSDEAEPGQS